MVLSEKLAALRKEHGYSQLYVAERLNVSRQAISRWEVGSSVPSTENLLELSRLYGVSLDELVGHTPTSDGQTIYLELGPEQQKTCVMNTPKKKFYIAVTAVCIAFLCLLAAWLWSRNCPQEENIVDMNQLQQEGSITPDGNFTLD